MRSISKTLKCTMVASFIAASGTGSFALAQQDGLVLEELIVTARKTEESIQDIPSTYLTHFSFLALTVTTRQLSEMHAELV